GKWKVRAGQHAQVGPVVSRRTNIPARAGSQRHSRLDLVDAGKVNADGVRLRQPDRIAGSVQRWFDGQNAALRTEPGSEFQQLIGVVYGRKADIRNRGKRRRRLVQGNQCSIEDAWIIALR